MRETLEELHAGTTVLSKVIALEKLVTELVAKVDALEAKRGPGRPPAAVAETKAA